ncbi:hypothetical protein [Sutcliffiella cohnii]|uniref:hypothetical protein n=1 Tax=Sutcliffiella cohnii TaxID=33932 RepID=UPI002E210BE6|nr:hypothetical protein [Sutcliffiella cohnii]
MKKYIYLLVVLTFFYAIIQFFREDSPKEYTQVKVEDENKSIENQNHQYDELYIKYLNDTEKLKEEINLLSSYLYETRVQLYDTDLFLEQFPYSDTIELIHKEQGQGQFIGIYKDIEGYKLLTFTADHPNTVTTTLDYLSSNTDSWNYEHGTIVGLTSNSAIDVLKLKIDNAELEIVLSEVEGDGIRFWYEQVDIESEQTLLESTIIAYDKAGNVLLEDFISKYR